MTPVWRALRLRCPNCGQGKMFRRWLLAIPVCTSCGFHFNRGEDDYYIGAYTINLIIAELIVVAAFVSAAVYTWPDVPWEKLPWMLLPGAILAPLITYPFSKSLWLGVDLLFRPAEPNDFTSSAAAHDVHP